MSKHTPGNWIIDEVEADLVEITAENRFGQVEIATVQLGYTGKIGDEQRANARLIAAAPEMLEALKAIDLFWSEDRPYGPETKGSRPGFAELHESTRVVWRQIRAAIAKAEGRQ